ncbi:MAG: response regulator [Lachnospiraceae bacterium]|nr:response regulator [Lachnospiraceae bacterium]
MVIRKMRKTDNTERILKYSKGYYIRTGLVVLLCAVVVLGFRLGYFPVATIVASGIAIPLSDFFIIVGAGLCGYQYGLAMFLAVFAAEIAMGRGNLLNLFPLFLYLILALTAGYAARNRWFQKIRMTALTACILEVELGNIFYLIFVYIFGGAETGYLTTLIGTLPETVASVALLYLYYRFAPEWLKKSFGLGYLYLDDGAAEGRDKLQLGKHITILSLTEGVIFGIVAVILSESVLGLWRDELVMPEGLSRFVLRVSVFLLALTLSISVAVIINEFIIGIIVSVVRKQDHLETALAVAEAGSEAKSAFLSSMSHEIRTPINAVLGMDEMILRESGEEQILEYAENIRVAGNTLLSLINDVLDFSKIEAGKMDIIPVEYDLASTLHDLVTMISMRAQKKGLLLETKVDKELPAVLYGDEIRIKQIVTNILTNAVKYTERGSVTLEVSGEKKDGEHIALLVKVRDTGIGIKAEDIGKLFSAFERIEEKRNRNIEGTGLGMNITTRLLAMMGSELEVESVYGEGSVFSFKLLQKVVSWKAIGDFETSWKETVKNSRKQTRTFTAPKALILAVDDTPMNLTVLSGLLKPTQIRIDTLESGKECLEKITQKKYDLIFLDHRMPEMDGVETLHRMETLEGNLNRDTPVVALTANAVSGAREEYLGYGFTDYLTKPVSMAALESMLLQYLPQEMVQETEEEDGAEKAVTEGIFGEAAAGNLPSVDGLDWEYASMHLPDRELLKTAVTDFYRIIGLHADRLEEMYGRLPDRQAFADYRIQVHGMKSSAATVGIIPLAGMAKTLENAAGVEDLTTIRDMHPHFLFAWRNYKEKLTGVFELGSEPDAEKQEFDEDILRGLLEIIRAAMEDFDIDRADAALKKLEIFRYPKKIRAGLERLKEAVADVDSEETEEAVKNIIAGLKEQR